MGDRLPTPPVDGALGGFVGATGTPVGYFDSVNRMTRVFFTAREAPSGGTTVVQINTADDGSGDGISVTIADGENFGTATGDISISAASYLYMLVTSDAGGAIGLSGYVEVERVSGVTTLLTTLAAVKLDGAISGTDADRDSLLNAIIAAVSKRMQSWMDRPIVQTTATGEKIDSIGDYVIQTRHYPIISVSSLAEDGTSLVEDTDFELNEEDLERGQIIRISGTDPIAWASGRRIVEITYSHGWASVPDDLVRAATAQVIYDYYQTKQSTRDWRGRMNEVIDPTASASFDKDFWERDTVPVMRPYRRLVM